MRKAVERGTVLFEASRPQTAAQATNKGDKKMVTTLLTFSTEMRAAMLKAKRDNVPLKRM